MNEIEKIEIDIQDLKNAYTNIVEAMNNIKDLDGLDETYRSLDIALYDIEDMRIKLEVELENLEEEAYNKENAEKWKREQRDQDYEYRRSVL